MIKHKVLPHLLGPAPEVVGVGVGRLGPTAAAVGGVEALLADSHQMVAVQALNILINISDTGQS